jgi:hypothetical protein
MNVEALERKIMSMALEDWTGLWEPLWYLKTVAPELEPEASEKLVESALWSLYSRGDIEFCEAEQWPDSSRAQIVTFDDVRVRATIDSRWWRERRVSRTEAWFAASKPRIEAHPPEPDD